MAYPILAPNSTWFAPTVSTVTRSMITEIEITDSYTPDSSVTVVDSWDASEAKDGSITCYVIGTKLIIAGNGSGKIAANEDSYQLFTYCEADWSAYDLPSEVEQILGLNILDTSNVRIFKEMFYSLSKISSLDLSCFDTSSATDLNGMFKSCNSLTSLNISTWHTGKVITTESMFNNCKMLEYVDGLDEFDTSNVTNMSRMFSYSKVTNFQNLDTSKVENMSYMFMEYQRESLVFPAWNLSNAINFEACFSGGVYGGVVKHLDLSNFAYKNSINASNLFRSAKTVETIILPKNFGRHMTSFRQLFSDCPKLKSINTDAIDLSNVSDISFMFYGCSSLKEIDVSNWDVSKITNFDHFAAHANLKRKGIENWNTSSATNMNALFHNCAEEELDLSGWDVSKVQFFCQMFENSPNLKRIKGLENWDTSSGLGFDEMFERCYKLEEVDLSAFNTTKAKNNVSASTNGHKTATMYNMFKDCRNLKKVTVGTNFSINGDGTNTTAANKLILPTPSADYITGADGMWYNVIGESFVPNGAKDKTAETYYASYDIVTHLDVLLKNGNLIDVAKAIREKTGNVDRLSPSAMATAIAGIQAGGGDAIKAFAKNPAGSHILVKNLVGLPDTFAEDYEYTNTQAQISVSFYFGNEGDTLIAAFVVRQQNKPTIPDGWEEIAFVPYAASSTTYQSLLVLKRVTTASEAKTSGTVQVEITQGQRAYVLVLNLGDTKLNESEIYEVYDGEIETISIPLFEHTLIICSSEITASHMSGTSSNYSWDEKEVYFDASIKPLYNDGSTFGGRLAAFFVPYKTHQTKDNANFDIITNSSGAGTSTTVSCCALGLALGKTTRYACNLAFE